MRRSHGHLPAPSPPLSPGSSDHWAAWLPWRPRPACPGLLFPVDTPPFAYHTSFGNSGDELWFPLTSLAIAHGAKAGIGKSTPLPRGGTNFSLPPPSPEHRVCAQGGSLRPQAGCPGADHSLPCVRGFRLTVLAAFLLFVSASGSHFLQGAVARMADGCPAAGPGESGPGRRPGRWRGNIQCDVSVPVGPGAMVGGVHADHSEALLLSLHTMQSSGPPEL